MWSSVFLYVLLGTFFTTLNISESAPPYPKKYERKFTKYSDRYSDIIYGNERLYGISPLRLGVHSPDSSVQESEEEVTKNYRLPNNTKPFHYDIEVSTDIHIDKLEFLGNVTIKIGILENSRTIVLHARQLTISEAKIQEKRQNTSFVMAFDYEDEREFLTLTPQDESVSFNTGEIWILQIQYNGTLRDDMGGFYVSTYLDKNSTRRSLATTQFESTDARHGFPCYDEPSKRATFTITIKHDPSYFALSNMPVDIDKSTTGVTVFQKTLNMPTYLVAFIVSDFKLTSGEIHSLPIRIGSRPGTEDRHKWALLTTMHAMMRLAEYFKLSFVFPKIDQIAIPDFEAGAMENWGLCTYREEYVLYNPKSSTVRNKVDVAEVIAHELTHQWFGDYVTPKWWTYLWLKEGFANLFEYDAIDQSNPEWDFYQRFHVWEFQYALRKDADDFSRPMTRNVQSPAEIKSMYSVISYSKAGSVLSMWRNALTDKIFREGLHLYLKQNAFGAADENDLFDAIQKSVITQAYYIPATIQEMMSSWTQQAGYPILYVKRNYDDGSFMIYQKSYISNASLHDERTWYIPFNSATKSNSDFRDTEADDIIRKTREFIVDIHVPSNDWLLLNKQSTGYYRINYDEKNWLLLAQGLKEQPYKFHPRNRAQLIDDSYEFCFSQRLSHTILMEILSYLSNESEYAPWDSASTIIFTMNRYLKYDPQYKIFQDFVAGLVGNIYEKLGFDEIPEEQIFKKFTRASAIDLTCMVAGIESCLKNCRRKLYDYIEQDIEVDPNIKREIFCNGMKHSSDYLFYKMLQVFTYTNDSALRAMLMSTLGCSQNEGHINLLLMTVINGGNNLEFNERADLLIPIFSQGGFGLQACINFVKYNMDEYNNVTQGKLNETVFKMTKYVVTKDQEKEYMEVVDLIINNGFQFTSSRSDIKGIVKKNAEWVKINSGPIMDWLTKDEKKENASGASANVSSISLLSILLLFRV